MNFVTDSFNIIDDDFFMDLSGLTQNNNSVDCDDNLDIANVVFVQEQDNSFGDDDIIEELLISTCESVEKLHSQEKTVNKNRFGTMSTEEEVNELSKKSISDATLKKNIWAINAFEAWREWRNNEAQKIQNQDSLSQIDIELLDIYFRSKEVKWGKLSLRNFTGINFGNSAISCVSRK